MVDIEEEAYEILSKHCDDLNRITDQLQKDLIKLHREKCKDTGQFCEMTFLETCLIGLRTMIVVRTRKKREANSKLN